jgi:hypothetical protein
MIEAVKPAFDAATGTTTVPASRSLWRHSGTLAQPRS